MPQHIRKGDVVKVISGDDSGRTGRVLRVLPKRGLVVVEGMNIMKKHVKPNPKQQQGGLIEKEAPMSLAKVQPMADGKGTRVRFQSRPDGSKVRVAASGGQVLGPEMKKVRR